MCSLERVLEYFFMRKKLYLIRKAKIKWDKNKPVYNNEKRNKKIKDDDKHVIVFFPVGYHGTQNT